MPLELLVFHLSMLGLLEKYKNSIGEMQHYWFKTIAGTAIRYRRRITLFQRLEMRTRVSGWDDRFTYVEQSLWRKGDGCAQAVLRTALTTGKGIVPPSEFAEVLDMPEQSPALPAWVQRWSEAEAERPWPPMQDIEPLQAAA